MLTKEQLQAIAACCRNSAAMLMVADKNEPANREAAVAANEGQAALLRMAAEMLEGA